MHCAHDDDDHHHHHHDDNHDDNHDEHDESEHDEHGDLLKVEEFQFAEWGFTSSPGGHERIAVEECPVIPAMFRCWKIQL